MQEGIIQEYVTFYSSIGRLMVEEKSCTRWLWSCRGFHLQQFEGEDVPQTTARFNKASGDVKL